MIASVADAVMILPFFMPRPPSPAHDLQFALGEFGVVVLQAREQMAVGVEGHLDRGVTEQRRLNAYVATWSSTNPQMALAKVEFAVAGARRGLASQDPGPTLMSRQRSALRSQVRMTLCWREPDSNHRSRRERGPSREAPRPTIVVSRDDLCLMTPSSLSVRHLSSATAERPFTRAGPMVRIRFPPAVSPCKLAHRAARMLGA